MPDGASARTTWQPPGQGFPQTGLTEFDYRTVLPDFEYNAFAQWYRQTYGADAPVPPNDGTIRTTPAFGYWQSQGSPGLPIAGRGEGGEVPDAEQYRWTPPTAEEPPKDELGQVVIPGQLLQRSDGTYYDFYGNAVSSTVAERMLREYETSGMGSAAQANALALRDLKYALANQPRTGYQPQMEQTFEQWRERLLGELTGPRDWITKWQVQQTINPYKRTEVDLQEEYVGQLEQRLAGEARQISTEEEQFPRGMAPPSESEYIKTSDELEKARNELDVLRRTPEGMAGMAIPKWLPEFVPGLRGQTTFDPTKAPTAVRPSAQQLARTPWSQREGLAGYVEATGGSWRDVLEKVEMSLPQKQPTQRWQPARQRA